LPRHQSETVLASYEGPLPLPGHIEHYNEILPGAAERIFAMAEAEQRSRLAINQNESLVATDLARQEMALQATVMRRRLNLEMLGTWLGFATTIVVIGAALVFAVYAPEKIEKIGALMIGFAYAAAQVIAAFRRGNGTVKSTQANSPDSSKELQSRKRKR
jgi:uncharacterized membrane protein